MTQRLTQIERGNNISYFEEKEPEKLEKVNIKTIEEVYQSLSRNEKIQDWIEKIKFHKWVNVNPKGDHLL